MAKDLRRPGIALVRLAVSLGVWGLSAWLLGVVGCSAGRGSVDCEAAALMHGIFAIVPAFIAGAAVRSAVDGRDETRGLVLAALGSLALLVILAWIQRQ